jgi:hybrid cluster-associated redox disulfide protein
MDRYTRSFIVASLVYLVLAAGLGVWMGVAGAPPWARFAHVHFNLLGFMAMMVYGVGYFILPRFNARELRWPSWVPIHFYVANIGLLGMVATYPDSPSAGFGIFSGLSVLAVALFAVNLIATLLAPADEIEAEVETAEVPAVPQPQIGPDTRVGEILTRWPQTAEIFVANGFASLGDPEHREQVKQMPITLQMACGRHGVDVGEMVEKLRSAARTGTSAAPEPVRSGGQATALRPAEAVGPDHVLGDILAAYPQTEGVFRKYYGSGCFSCPGQATESVKQSAMMHNVDMKQLLRELNQAARASAA